MTAPVVTRRRSRSALVIVIVLAVALTALVAVLATSGPAENRVSRSPLLGKPAPPIQGTVLVGAGGRYDLQSARGRYVLVNFFGSNCVPCQKEHPELIRFAADHARLGDASVVSVVFGDTDANVQAFFRQRGGDWPVVADEDGAVGVTWGVAAVPESFLVSPEGTVLAKIVGGVQSDGLDQLLRDAEKAQS